MPASNVLNRHDTPGSGSRHPADPALGARIVQTFVSPGRLFAGFHDGTPWLGVLAISTLVAMAAAATLPPEYFLERMDGAVTRLGKPVEITSPPGEIVRWGRYLEVLSALAMHPMIAFGVAGLLTLVFSVIGRGRGSFRQYLAVASHALLIYALGTIVGVALRVATGDAAAEPTIGRLFSLVAPEVASNAFLNSLNVFTLWMLVVLAGAVAVVEGRPSWTRPTAALVGVYLLLAGASVLIAS